MFDENSFDIEAFDTEAFLFDLVAVAYGGSGYPVYAKIVRPKSVGEIVNAGMASLYSQIVDEIDEFVPRETKEKAAELIRPFAKTEAEIPKSSQIDWVAFEKDIARIEAMINLYIQMEEDLILMAYVQFYG